MEEKQKIVIAQLDIDTSALLTSAKENKKTIDELKSGLKGLLDENGKVTEAYLLQETRIKKLTTEYNAQMSVLNSTVDATGKLQKSVDAANDSVNREINTIAEARRNNTELLKIRNEVNAKTDEGQAALKLINEKLNENNAFIKANVSEYEQQKIGIGQYKEGIIAAAQELGAWGGGMQTMGVDMGVFNGLIEKGSSLFSGLKDSINENLKSISDLTKGTGAARAATEADTNATNANATAKKMLATSSGVATAAVKILGSALAATGIGLLITAVALLISYFRTFKPITDVVEQAFAGLGAVIKVAQQGVSAFVSGFSDLGGTLKKIGGFLADPIGGFRDMAKSMGEAYSAAAQLKKEIQDLEYAIASQEIASAKNRAEINRLNVMSKDRTKTETERLALLAKAAKLEEEDYNQRKANADEAQRIALQQIINEAKLTEAQAAELRKRGFNYREYAEGLTNNTDELFDKLKAAEMALIALDDEKTVNIEKNVNRQNKILEDQEAAREKAQKAREEAEKKAEERRKKILDDAAALSKAEIDNFISSQGVRAKSVEEELKNAEKLRDLKLIAAQKEFDASEKNAVAELNLLTAQNDIKNEFLKQQIDAVVSASNTELDAIRAKNAAILESDKFLNAEVFNNKKTALDNILAAELAHQETLLTQGVINQQAYDAAINEAKEANRISNEELQAQRDEAANEKRLIDIENELAFEAANLDRSLALKLDKAKIQRQNELDNAEKTGADKAIIIAKYDKIEKDLRAATEEAKLSSTASALSQAKGLFKENTVAYKTMAIAEATINTYLGASKALADYSFPMGPIFAALTIASGLVQVSKIAGIKFERGGIGTKKGSFLGSQFHRIKGKSHAQGGEPVYIGDQYIGEAQSDEGVGILNRSAFGAFMDFNNKHNNGAKSSPSFYEGGGIITTALPSNNVTLEDMAYIAAETAKSVPPPVVYVDEINQKQNAVEVIESGADF